MADLNIRLECLQIAQRSQGAYDPRPVLDIAEDLLQFATGGEATRRTHIVVHDAATGNVIRIVKAIEPAIEPAEAETAPAPAMAGKAKARR